MKHLRGNPERGDSSLSLVLLIPVLYLLLGLVIDGSGKIQADQNAYTIAQSAARAGANAGTEIAYKNTNKVTIDPYTAQYTARQYITTAGATGTATATTTTVTATATTTYRPKLLPLGTMKATRTATAQPQSN